MVEFLSVQPGDSPELLEEEIARNERLASDMRELAIANYERTFIGDSEGQTQDLVDGKAIFKATSDTVEGARIDNMALAGQIEALEIDRDINLSYRPFIIGETYPNQTNEGNIGRIALASTYLVSLDKSSLYETDETNFNLDYIGDILALYYLENRKKMSLGSILTPPLELENFRHRVEKRIINKAKLD